MATVLERKTTVGEYLDRDHAADRKLEFVGGEVREMTGASRSHNLVCWNVLIALGRLMDRSRFEAYPGNMRVRAEAEGPFYYPDVAVAPAPPEILRDRGDTLLNPVAIFEILSPSTETIDRREKLANYGRIPTLIDYVLVAQDEVRIDHLARQADGSWKLVILEGIDRTLALPSIGVELSLAELYEHVLPDAPEG
ncbi:MAG TPA: Uma2 family endonuclease [Planctomycetaceae bacterium]